MSMYDQPMPCSVCSHLSHELIDGVCTHCIALEELQTLWLEANCELVKANEEKAKWDNEASIARNTKSELEALMLGIMQREGYDSFDGKNGFIQMSTSKRTMIDESKALEFVHNAGMLNEFIKFSDKKLKEVLPKADYYKCVETVEVPRLKFSIE